MIRKSLFPVLLLVALAVSAAAQQPRPGAAGVRPSPTPVPAPAAAAPAPGSVALPTSKLAIIYTDEFLDAKTGILKFTSVLNRLNGEFQKLKDELTAMNNRAAAL